MRFIQFSRTMTDAELLASRAPSGNYHPVHYDREYCRARGMADMLAHGLQTLIQTAAGTGMLSPSTCSVCREVSDMRWRAANERRQCRE